MNTNPESKESNEEGDLTMIEPFAPDPEKEGVEIATYKFGGDEINVSLDSNRDDNKILLDVTLGNDPKGEYEWASVRQVISPFEADPNSEEFIERLKEMINTLMESIEDFKNTQNRNALGDVSSILENGTE